MAVAKNMPTLTSLGLVSSPEHLLDFLLVDYYTAQSNQLTTGEINNTQNTLKKSRNKPSRCPQLLEADISEMLKTDFDHVSIMVTSNDSDTVNRVAYVCEITVTTQNDRYQTEKTFFDDKSLFRRLTNDLNSGAAYA